MKWWAYNTYNSSLVDEINNALSVTCDCRVPVREEDTKTDTSS